MTAQEQSLQGITPELIIQRAKDMIPYLREQAE